MHDILKSWFIFFKTMYGVILAAFLSYLALFYFCEKLSGGSHLFFFISFMLIVGTYKLGFDKVMEVKRLREKISDLE
jgi:hypothetical protein